MPAEVITRIDPAQDEARVGGLVVGDLHFFCIPHQGRAGMEQRDVSEEPARSSCPTTWITRGCNPSRASALLECYFFFSFDSGIHLSGGVEGLPKKNMPPVRMTMYISSVQ